MHTLVVGLIGAALGFALGWFVKAKYGTKIGAIETDVKQL